MTGRIYRWWGICCLTACLIGILPYLELPIALAQPLKQKPMQVELNLYSGRPNPQWNLNTEETQYFLRLFRNLPVVSQGKVQPSMGYSGISVTSLGKQVAEFDIIICYAGTVSGYRQGIRQKRFADRNRALERWLFQTSKDKIDLGIQSIF